MIRIRWQENDWLGVAVSTVVGLGVGMVGGMILGELFGDMSPRRLSRAVRDLRRERETSRKRAATVEHVVRDALRAAPDTAGLAVTVRAVGNGIVELTGTVPSDEQRERAAGIARAAASAEVVVNRLLVEGDDAPRRSAPSRAR